MTNKNFPVPHRRYEVGYGKPPRETQFKKGRSGNPKGRPRGSKNKNPRNEAPELLRIFEKEATRLVPILDGTERIRISMLEAVFKSAFIQAAKGDHRSQKLVLEIARLNEKAQQQVERENDLEKKTVVLWGRNADE